MWSWQYGVGCYKSVKLRQGCASFLTGSTTYTGGTLMVCNATGQAASLRPGSGFNVAFESLLRDNAVTTLSRHQERCMCKRVVCKYD